MKKTNSMTCKDKVLGFTNIKDNSGYIYLIRTSLCKNIGENIYKVGKTKRDLVERLREYGPGIDVCITLQTSNHTELENKIKKVFKETFELVQGSEWFRGDVTLMINIIYTENSLICEYDKIQPHCNPKLFSNDFHIIREDISDFGKIREDVNTVREDVNTIREDYCKHVIDNLGNRDESVDIVSLSGDYDEFLIYSRCPDIYYLITLCFYKTYTKHCLHYGSTFSDYMNELYDKIQGFYFSSDEIILYIDIKGIENTLDNLCSVLKLDTIKFSLSDLYLCQEIYKMLLDKEIVRYSRFENRKLDTHVNSYTLHLFV